MTIYAFGLLVSLALALGYWLTVRRAVRLGLPGAAVRTVTLHTLFWGFLGSHAIWLLTAQRAQFAAAPFQTLFSLHGIYSYGGIASGVAAAGVAAWRAGFTAGQLLRYLDAAGYAFPVAWILGRAGCSLAHDHIGAETTSWLAVRFPEGPRFDLGLLELLFTLAYVTLSVSLDRWRRWPPPFFFGLFLLMFGCFRLWLHTLRPEGGDWTPDQAFSAGAILLGATGLLVSWLSGPGGRGQSKAEAAARRL